MVSTDFLFDVVVTEVKIFPNFLSCVCRRLMFAMMAQEIYIVIQKQWCLLIPYHTFPNHKRGSRKNHIQVICIESRAIWVEEHPAVFSRIGASLMAT